MLLDDFETRRGAIQSRDGAGFGRLTVVEDVDVPVHEVIEGQVTVHGRGILRLHGTLVGDLRVQAGGVAIVDGVLTGDAINAGGRLLMFGWTQGRIHELGGWTHIDASARIGAPW